MEMVRIGEKSINEIMVTIKEKQLNLSRLEFKTRDKFVLIGPIGTEKIKQEDDYYENAKENLIFANYSWLSPLCDDLNCPFQGHLEVLPSGEMNHHNIDLTISIPLSGSLEKAKIMSTLYEQFKVLEKYRNFIQFFDVSGFKYMTNLIHVSLKIPGNKITPLLKEAKTKPVNKQIISQWLATVENIMDQNANNFSYSHKVYAVDGRMQSTTFESKFTFKVHQRRGIFND